jgi:hypothetical protein
MSPRSRQTAKHGQKAEKQQPSRLREIKGYLGKFREIKGYLGKFRVI